MSFSSTRAQAYSACPMPSLDVICPRVATTESKPDRFSDCGPLSSCLLPDGMRRLCRCRTAGKTGSRLEWERLASASRNSLWEDYVHPRQQLLKLDRQGGIIFGGAALWPNGTLLWVNPVARLARERSAALTQTFFPVPILRQAQVRVLVHQMRGCPGDHSFRVGPGIAQGDIAASQLTSAGLVAIIEDIASSSSPTLSLQNSSGRERGHPPFFASRAVTSGCAGLTSARLGALGGAC